VKDDGVLGAESGPLGARSPFSARAAVRIRIPLARIYVNIIPLWNYIDRQFRPTPICHWPAVCYLVYLNKVDREDPSLKTEDFPDQKRAP